MERTPDSVDEHLQSLAVDGRPDLAILDVLIAEEMPGAARILWEGRMWGGSDQRIVGYGALSYERPGKDPVEWFVVGLAAQKDHISMYVNAVGNGGRPLAAEYADRLGKVKVGSAAITFQSAADLDLDAVREMIAEAHRLSEL